MRHGISGPPESIKTVVAWILAREHVRAGNTIAVVDFEMGPYATRRLLLDLGFTLDEIRDQVVYYDAPGEPGPADIAAMVEAKVTFVVIDATAGAYDASGLDDNKRRRREVRPRLGASALRGRDHERPDRPRHEERRDAREVHDRLGALGRSRASPKVSRQVAERPAAWDSRPEQAGHA